MPITFKIADHDARAVVDPYVRFEQETNRKDTIASTVPPASDKTYMAQSNGFVNTVVQAYNQHHHLIIRPDDVWSAITVQFSYSVKLHAEKLRPTFVDFQGTKKLKMSGEIAKNIKDPSIREWVLPGFTTTTGHDKVVGAVVLMAAVQSYFRYAYYLLTVCGLPSVTLLSELADWQALEARAKRLVEFDAGDGLMTTWSKLLAPVLAHLTLTAQGKPSTDFWSKVCHHVASGSGPPDLSGWLAVFAVFDTGGRWVGQRKSFECAPRCVASVPFRFCSVFADIFLKLRLPYKTTLSAGHFGCTIVDGTGLQPALHRQLTLATDRKKN
ncbi:hypothetical protein JKP88DRAFT_280725 [Tribonema minus]|uniref:Uncharacterized protein n=1 Tax=Tribonema minus TaxID=303371 RepID=A0A835YYL6_9STRA|nr:hypothetical protein JKP88DRAFT_280725 [Tribonema minus]